MAVPIHSIHVLGSREFGGADQFYVRLVRALQQAGQPVTAIHRPASPVAAALATDSFERVHLPLCNRWDAWSWWKIRQAVHARQPCVVQTYMGRATRLTRVPKQTVAVHLARLGGFYKIDGYYRHADAWVGNTRAICDFLVRSGLPAQRVYHIGNFVPEPIPTDSVRKEALRRELRLPGDTWVIFALGRLIPKKGFHDLFRAIARLPAEISGRQPVLLLAGDGPEMGNLQTLAKELGIEARLRMLGWQDPPDAYYGLADVFVCPSRHEPLGNVILEAWNHALPVISTRSDGAQELIEDGITGVLCDCKDDTGMAAAIREVLASPAAQRAAMGAAANACLHARYGQRKIVASYLSLYRELFAGKFG